MYCIERESKSDRKIYTYIYIYKERERERERERQRESAGKKERIGERERVRMRQSQRERGTKKVSEKEILFYREGNLYEDIERDGEIDIYKERGE